MKRHGSAGIRTRRKRSANDRIGKTVLRRRKDTSAFYTLSGVKSRTLVHTAAASLGLGTPEFTPTLPGLKEARPQRRSYDRSGIAAKKGLSLQANRKRHTWPPHPDRDRRFAYIQTARLQRCTQSNLSVMKSALTGITPLCRTLRESRCYCRTSP